ncbi:MAG: hypothetical protein E7645_02995 [Ruminococcaceae bacterium]|nr:hypothetical protein [Oscillospiraceae bacterium]
MKIDKMTIFQKLGEIDKNYVMEADNAYISALTAKGGKERPIRRFLDWLNSGFGVALICFLVAGGAMAGIIYAGNASDGPGALAGSIEPPDSEKVQENRDTDDADTRPSDINSSVDGTSDTKPELSDLEKVLTLAHNMKVPEGRVYRSDTAFFTRVLIDGAYTSKVMRMMITVSEGAEDDRRITLELLNDDGTVIESHTMVMPNLGFLCYLRPAPVETDPVGGPVDTFVFLGLQVNNTFTPPPEGSEPMSNVVLQETYFSWEESDGSDTLLNIRDQSKYVGQNSLWDVDFKAELQAELEEIVPHYAECFTGELYIACEDDCASMEMAEKMGYTLDAEIWQNEFFCNADAIIHFAHEIYGQISYPAFDDDIDAP